MTPPKLGIVEQIVKNARPTQVKVNYTMAHGMIVRYVARLLGIACFYYSISSSMSYLGATASRTRPFLHLQSLTVSKAAGSKSSHPHVNAGTAVYVFCVLARTRLSPTGNSDMSFFIDGELVGTL